MRYICPPEKCTGCYACYNSCSHSAIEIVEDSCGFKYPKINTEICVECNLCFDSCPVNHPVSKVFPSKCYAVSESNNLKLLNVASGGAATILSEKVIANGGCVFGCTGKDIRNVRHIKIDKSCDINLLAGSKYVQSDINNTLKELRKEVLSGRQVLFIGTPCQAAGVRRFMRKDYKNLIIVDLVCHGVPSQKLLNENIKNYTDRYNDIDVNTISFRKKINNQTQSAMIEFGWFFKRTNHTQAVKYTKDPYMLGFLECLFFRPSCYICDYAYCIRCSDITLSDYWGLGKNNANLNVGNGVSAVLINTEKGETFAEESLNTCIKELRTIQEAISGNGQLMCPSRKTPYVDKFRELYPDLGLKRTVNILMKKRRIVIMIMNINSLVELKF